MNEPISYDEFISNKMIIYDLNKWWKEYQLNKKQHIVIITGISGIGKSLLVKLFTKLNNIELKDYSYFDNKSLNKYKENISDLYSFHTILEIMYQVKIAILLDNIDSYGTDKKGINDILKIILKSKIKKLTFVISRINLDKIFGKNKNIKILNLKRPSFIDIENYIFAKSIQNKFLINNNAIKYVYDISNSDIRLINQLINNILSYIPIKKTKLKMKDEKFMNIDIDDIKILLSNKDIDYQLYDLVNKLLFEKNTIDNNIKYTSTDLHFLPTILYDNLESVLAGKKDGLKKYSIILDNIILGEYINNKTFENQNNLTYEYRAFIISCYVNYFVTPSSPINIQYSILMNKLLKISNLNKFKNDLTFKLPKNIKLNNLSLLLEVYNYMNKKNNKEDKLIEYFESLDIDYKKLLKHF
jgi:hypothetical protein